jgi:hypothetical protein
MQAAPTAVATVPSALGGVVATYAADDLFDARRKRMARWAIHVASHRAAAN